MIAKGTSTNGKEEYTAYYNVIGAIVAQEGERVDL